MLPFDLERLVFLPLCLLLFLFACGSEEGAAPGAGGEEDGGADMMGQPFLDVGLDLAADATVDASDMGDLVLCGEGERVQGGSCVACPPGTTNGAGDDASRADTSCEAVLCGEGERVQDHACVACPAGEANGGGG